MRGGLYEAAMYGDTDTVLDILAEAENIELFREKDMTDILKSA